MSVQIKRSQSTTTPSSLNWGQLAYSEASSTLYIGYHNSSVVAVGGSGTFALLANPAFTGTATLNSYTLATQNWVSAQDYAPLLSPALTGTPTVNGSAIASEAWVTGQDYLTGNQTITLSGKVSGSGTTSITTTVTLANTDIPQTLTHVWISDFYSAAETITLDQFAMPVATVNFNDQTLTGLAAPVNPSDAATKAYVDALSIGLSIRDSCVVATVANITLSGLQSIDGHTVAAGDRVLVKNQTDATQNGLYVASATAWARATDANSSANLVSGIFTFIELGTVNQASSWVLNTQGTITPGTTDVSFAQFSAGSTYSAGNGLLLTGSVFSAVGTAGTISVSSAGITIDAGYIGQDSITTTGTLTAGSIDGTTYTVDDGTF